MPVSDRSPIFDTIADRVAAAASVADVIADIRSSYDLDHVTYHLVRNVSDGVDSPYVRTTYPMDWVGVYVVRQYVDKDPVIRAGISRAGPFNWASLAGDAGYEEVMSAAEAYGIWRSGYSVPIIDKRRRRALFSVNSRREPGEWQDHLSLYARDWLDLAHLVHRKAVFEAYGEKDPLPQLGPREIECLTWTARGKEAKEIAAILRLSEHTVRAYLKSARHKIGAGTLSQAVSQALKYHLIAP